MSSKAERTSQYIIETVAPVFNKYGYIGTSMSDLTKATGLTKGAIYGNFENKEALALASYEYNSKRLLSKIDELLAIPGTALDKIFNFTRFYKHYDVFTIEMGGCPVLNTGVDAFNNNRLLTAANREILREIEGKIALVLENGVIKNELNLPVTPLQFAKQLFTMLQGAVSMFTISQDRKYLINTVAYLDLLIKNELVK